ncbi:MAG: glucosamine-6-phosphate deaminase [Bacteroidetes bacterium]|nr:glucosamine-6-phosphate deaminase [Bacteroidota bacterium]
MERRQTDSESESRFERVPVLIFENSSALARHAATRIAAVIQERNAEGRNAVLGLPTGSTPIGVYQELVRMHAEEGLDLSRVVSFNLDEYYPISTDSLQSYHRFMFENFFDHVNIPRENIHIPRGDVPPEEIEAHCVAYERMIAEAGGIDLMLLGIGRSGHVGFNEPGSAIEDRTRLIVLDEITRKDAASDFFDEKNVPLQAITMGVGTILESREIILMATGEHKAPIIRRAVEEKQSSDVSATYLQNHPNTSFYLDRASASQLTRVQTPWLVRHVEWDDLLAKRAVIWLSETVEKPIQWLDASDFHRHHLHDLVHGYSSVDHLCQQIYEDLRGRITYGHELPGSQRVLVFSPHPDDDVISMGGVLAKLTRNGNEVTVAYMTNGSVAVFDEDIRRHLRFVEMCADSLLGGADFSQGQKRVDEILDFLDKKEPAQVDLPLVQKLKAFIRYTEAISAIEVMGLGPENARFLDMPFYKTGRVKKDPISAADVEIVQQLLRELKPDHVFVAGDLSDPHGTHRMCYKAIKQAVELEYGTSGIEGSRRHHGHHPEIGRPLIWLYRGAWQEWEIDKADVFLPLSKADLDQKIEAIYKHESQKDRALFPGAYDTREFWQRARDRNRDTAQALDNLGLPQFYAAEAFVTVYDLP